MRTPKLRPVLARTFSRLPMGRIALIVTLLAAGMWVSAGFLRAAGATTIADLLSMAAYAVTALTIVVGSLSVIATPSK